MVQFSGVGSVSSHEALISNKAFSFVELIIGKGTALLISWKRFNRSCDKRQSLKYDDNPAHLILVSRKVK